MEVRVKMTRPYTPRTNAKAKRLIKTLLEEWVYREALQQLSGSQ